MVKFTPIEIDMEPKDTYGNTPLHEAARAGHLEVLKVIPT